MAANANVIATSAQLLESGVGVRFDAVGGRLSAFAVRWQGRVRAYLNVCLHQGTELDWMPGSFFDGEADRLVCATHGALFEPDTGRCAGGPCKGQSLKAIDVWEADGVVRLGSAPTSS